MKKSIIIVFEDLSTKKIKRNLIKGKLRSRDGLKYEKIDNHIFYFPTKKIKEKFTQNLKKK